MKSKLKLFLDWGITFEKPYITEEKAQRKVYYADKNTLETNILKDRDYTAQNRACRPF